MEDFIEVIRQAFRFVIRRMARWLHRVSRGKVTPDAVTIFGVLMHVPIAIMIARGRLVWAAVFLIIFGLFDVLDGELARIQKTDSAKGMLLDASTDRVKEVMLYTGVAYFLASSNNPTTAVWAVAACGMSLLVSYVKAKGEAAIASSKKIVPHSTLNRMFADGLASFEVRICLLALGLLTDLLLWAVILVSVLAAYTALGRLAIVSKKLS